MSKRDHLGVAQLIDVEDMIMMGDRPDYKVIFTYLSTFHEKLELIPAMIKKLAHARPRVNKTDVTELKGNSVIDH